MNIASTLTLFLLVWPLSCDEAHIIRQLRGELQSMKLETESHRSNLRDAIGEIADHSIAIIESSDTIPAQVKKDLAYLDSLKIALVSMSSVLDSIMQQIHLYDSLITIGHAQNSIDSIGNSVQSLDHRLSEAAILLNSYLEAHKKVTAGKKPFSDATINLRTLTGGSRVNMGRTSYDIFVADSTMRVELALRGDNRNNLRSIAKVDSMIRVKNGHALMITNAGMFKENGDPQGLYIEYGRKLQEIDLRQNLYGNFYMKPNGVFVIDTSGKFRIVQSEYIDTLNNNISHATQSGPLLVIGGQIHPKFNPESTSRFIRNGVGILHSGKAVFVISNEPVTFYEFSIFFRDVLGCKDALYLDGAISTMFIPEMNRLQRSVGIGPMIVVRRN